MASPYRRQALELYRLLIRGASHVMPTQAGRDFMIRRVRSEFRAHRNETDIPRSAKLRLQVK